VAQLAIALISGAIVYDGKGRLEEVGYGWNDIKGA